jgi:hypothetical protein
MLMLSMVPLSLLFLLSLELNEWYCLLIGVVVSVVAVSLLMVLKTAVVLS